ncbi:transmembrane and immunoglobulin domain-containing protein 1 isoform X3 [Cynoglossus semilaevis]|uniref:Transmembrane and immunoglobulin domain containing 1 n=1 Tax=Cynoglossus semilaevis TaxID=244447 RepID=A0A3P8VS61_CYNSE|nr:transmembrane and immunoglobulin domain-containing protein 1 isoform X3 [Cynoglossus semilaevis]XP_016897446.1 transmembrane and immunoglobulin domain-containing protein 1 isoform X3 [Cynoglossus semilaevis]XP_024921185.1 transmembrane and immunoglobulin domain-containing protein 1 isoform X3 [Cynoglossus semilaevis]XP_024921186.1 transmembrane and immunoglobulin domain-containing protein 1 isoform X3 [Cynoglossus semilaevis]XP_024921187.1 transmembrane and immunoglobulin domain-containing p
MKLVLRDLLFIFCAAQTIGVRIQSDPASSGGVIQTELKTTVSLLCQPEGSAETETDEELVWLRNGVMVSLKDDNKIGRSSVCVTPVIYEDNEATFTCHLSNNATRRASITLNVTYPPELSGSAEVSVEDSADLILNCDIWANPPVSSVLWTLNGSEVDLVAGRFTVSNDGFTGRLSSTGIERSLHEGVYQCTVVSPMYGTFSKYFQVTVTEKTIKFPLMPMIAGIVVVCLTSLLAVVARWRTFVKCFKSCKN